MSKEFTFVQENGSSSSSEKGIEDFDTAMASMDTPDSPPSFSFNNNTADQQASSSSTSGNQANTSGSRNTNGASDPKTQFGAPGSCWQTKKFHEEYERVDANLLDRNWSPTQFRDPLSR